MPRFGDRQRLERFNEAVSSLRDSGARLTQYTIAAQSGLCKETAMKYMIEQGIVSESATRKKRERPKAIKQEPRSASFIVREAKRIRQIIKWMDFKENSEP